MRVWNKDCLILFSQCSCYSIKKKRLFFLHYQTNSFLSLIFYHSCGGGKQKPNMRVQFELPTLLACFMIKAGTPHPNEVERVSSVRAHTYTFSSPDSITTSFPAS